MKLSFFVLTLAMFDPPAGRTAELIFRSGFEHGVTLEPPVIGTGDAWEQYITGGDQGYDWEQDLPQRPFNPRDGITYLVSGSQYLPDYAETRIDSVIGHDGQPTRALYMELKNEDPLLRQSTRTQFGIHPPADFTQAYARFWLKFQPNLDTEILPPGEAHDLEVMEWKENGSDWTPDFRFGIYMARESAPHSQLYWYTWAQFGDKFTSPTAWKVISTAPVPVGKWFQFEVFWKLGVTDGVLWATADGQTIVNYTGQTQKDSGLYAWWPFKVYAGEALDQFGGRPIYQWMDDFELYTKVPSIQAP